MQGIQSMLRVLIILIGFVAFALAGDSQAEDFLMQLPSYPKLTYRINAANQLIRPEPFQIRFARKDSNPFCTRVVEVGIYASTSDYNFGYFPAPGVANTPISGHFRSKISGGAALCSFNFNDDLVSLDLQSVSMEGYVRDRFTQATNIMSNNYYLNRRTKRQYEIGQLPFRVFLQKNGGGYDWKNVASPTDQMTCNNKACYLRVEMVEEPIANLPPTIDSVLLSTDTLPANGGTIKVVMIVIDDVSVKKIETAYSVGSQAYNPQQLYRTGTLGKTTRGYEISKWEGEYTIPANTAYASRRIAINFKVYDGEGGVTDISGANAKVVQQAGLVDSAPPQIQGVTVTPQNFPASGGLVTVSVRASDNQGVGMVMLTLTMPDGRTSPMQMPLVGGTTANGEWRSSWNMWANTTASPLSYGIKVTATDVSKNTVSSQTFPVIVAGAAPRTIKPATTAPSSIQSNAPTGLKYPLPVK